jgi:ATP-dependent helicase YprA (DUF1998 family)/very-short-patch-repair endonuclease
VDGSSGMDVFGLRDHLIGDYARYINSFIRIRDPRIETYVHQAISEGLLWPEPLIQLNPSFEPGAWIDDLVDQSVLSSACRDIFRIKADPTDSGRPMRLHKHQADAIKTARTGESYVVTTGTGSGKSLAYIVPIVDYVLRFGSGQGTKALVVYPMNALANSQYGELEKFLRFGFPKDKEPVTFARYTGQESEAEREKILSNPPDILLTNYVMLELILTRPREKKLVKGAQNLAFLVLDELHTYRGRQGADVALLVRRVKDALGANSLQCVGTSATLASTGTYEEQRDQIAQVASDIFGTVVKPESVIGETLRRATPDRDVATPEFQKQLTQRIQSSLHQTSNDYQTFVNDPLSIWIESTFGVHEEPSTGRLVRTKPRSIGGEQGAAQELANITGVDPGLCVSAIRQGLLRGYECERNPETGFPAFAFRLHQFISRGDTVYSTLEPEDSRYITVYGQQFVPNDRERTLLPLVFCRECGQEYYCVRRFHSSETERVDYFPRLLSDQYDNEQGEAGFLYVSAKNPWPDADSERIERLPDDWIETPNGEPRIRNDRREHLPRSVWVSGNAYEVGQGDGNRASWLSAPFRFCLCCGVSYSATQKDDFSKLSALSSEGRSTATTILSLAAIRRLRGQVELPVEAQKLLSFTDNRQDASLQAGHFNDFVEIALLRAALCAAVKKAGDSGLRYDELPQKVFDALKLPKSLYAANPEERFAQEKETQSALRNVLAYRLYRDLKRGWRVTSPNLEQCGLLQIQYSDLTDVCEAEDIWQGNHPVLVSASPETRCQVVKTLLDFMRRELAVKVDYLEDEFQERLRQQSSQKLSPKSAWAIDETEKLETSAVLFPRSRQPGDYGGNLYLSARGGFGQYLRRSTTFPESGGKLTVKDTETIIQQLFNVLTVGGLVERVTEPSKNEAVPGYQIPASVLLWMTGNGTEAFHDPIRVPRKPIDGRRTNDFFVAFYQTVASELLGLEAREHTAQVRTEDRQEREDRFRKGELPILYCSPTMELGVDISRLNVVNMRNVPPTPANYAQRSGRAGRSGQPALVFSYCTTGSSHDQYFFKRPQRMVSGAVTPPRLDLANEDLVRAHIHAMWLAETGMDLGRSLKEILDLAPDPSGKPSLKILPSKQASIDEPKFRAATKKRAERVLATIHADLKQTDWYTERWLDDAVSQVGRLFDSACQRWRGLYWSALEQQELQNRIAIDPSRPPKDKETARILRKDAENQLELLTEVDDTRQSDFYSYRYFASEGFLPGYNFPRLPLSAYIPARSRKQKDEFLSRPRFLAISEFGPRSIVYHEGSRYEINKVIMPVGKRDDEDDLLSIGVKLCPQCGYLHPLTGGAQPDLCERCKEPLDLPMNQLFRLENVSTRRRERISSDEEERQRFGYEILTGVRFTDFGNGPSYRTAEVRRDGKVLARLAYGPTATLWRINLGWSRRKNPQEKGFLLDIERGFWARNELDLGTSPADPLSARTAKVIPYVEDRRNCLLFIPEMSLDGAAMASLQAALKTAIQITFQLEDSELAAEPLPNRDNRRHLLLYEAAEGGAGVLRRLIDDSSAMAQVATEALRLCHFDPLTGADERKAPGASEECEAGCYDCLMSYANQRDHQLLDRQKVREFLMSLTGAQVVSSSRPTTRADHRDHLLRLTDSELERRWLRFLDEAGYRLPTDAQVAIRECQTRPDFLYQSEGNQAVIYIDGPPHDYPDRQNRDAAQEELLEDKGWLVIRFHHEEDWVKKLATYPSVFGRPS